MVTDSALENRQLTKLALHPPDFLEEAFGYKGDASRFVAFYWIPYGDELCFSDDCGESGTINYQAWLLLRHHPFSGVFLHGFDFGSSEEDAVHWLLLDRHNRGLWAGKKEDVQAFLDSRQRPYLYDASNPPDQLYFEDFMEVIRERLENMPEPDIEAIMLAIQDEQVLYNRLDLWLNGQLIDVVAQIEREENKTQCVWQWLQIAKDHLQERSER